MFEDSLECLTDRKEQLPRVSCRGWPYWIFPKTHDFKSNIEIFLARLFCQKSLDLRKRPKKSNCTAKLDLFGLKIEIYFFLFFLSNKNKKR